MYDDESERVCHPLLRGGRDSDHKYKNGCFSSSDIQTLSSICEVILPPIPSNSNSTSESFSTASASKYPIPNKVVDLVLKRGFLEAVLVVKLVLILLSSRLGTLLLSGSLCLSHKWPFINKFSAIPLQKRDKIVQKWLKHSFITPIRLGFVFIKTLCLLVFFTQVIVICKF
ncbi:hypothetical protein OSB04_028329 [Centaurea solstitialis]|uniref:Uncharacterized protein n=1 Tax=Centaurea solstitialis TaxID=347529 RepID=A0AA38T0C8_9ASTR|nr:hypothetical protein OSB04_028329 [Centaurea solstitialis]